MIKEHSLLIYIVDLLMRKCQLIWLALEVNEIIYWLYVLQGHAEKGFLENIFFYLLYYKKT